ncbi:MAG: hypothetical protein SFW62_01660 [Alphaproteobacteria bacterium]|nr:hypothetical protein [Alphaproteobacteria bacterium]
MFKNGTKMPVRHEVSADLGREKVAPEGSGVAVQMQQQQRQSVRGDEYIRQVQAQQLQL